MKRILIVLAITLLIFSTNSFAQRETVLSTIDVNLPSSSKLTAAQLRTALKSITNSAFDGLDTKITTTAANATYFVKTDTTSLTSIVYTKSEVDALIVSRAKELGIPRQIFPALTDTYAFPYSKTGDLNETTVLTFTIPASSIGINGHFEMFMEADWVGAGGSKVIRVKFGSTVVANIYSVAGTSGARNIHVFSNRSSHTSHVWANVSSDPSSGAITTAGAIDFTTNTGINTASDITCTVTMQLGNAADVLRLQTFYLKAY